MSKLLFLIHLGDIKKSSGIIEKVINQSKSMRKLGIHYKTYILYRPSHKQDTLIFDKYDFIKFVPIKNYEVQTNVIKKIILEEKMFNEYIKIAKKEEGNYDYIYVRYNPLYHTFIKFCNIFKDKIIFEHNSLEKSEYKSNERNLYMFKEILFGKYVRNKAKNFVCVSKEIFEYQSNLYKKNNGITITNGIDVDKFSKRNVPKYNGKTLNIVFVGNIRYWHGIDRMLKSISKYKGKVKIVFEICGLSNEFDNITPLIKKIKTNHIINQNGFKTQEELNKYFDKAHIAMGCLGAYKKHVTSATTLKNREYFARGIPIVFSETDDDICVKENEGLYLQVENNDSIFDMEIIINFVEEFYKNAQNNTDKIRKYAEDNLKYDTKIKKLEVLLNEK